MKPFSHEETLKGKPCKTTRGDLAIIYGDTKNSPYLGNKCPKILVGVIITKDKHVFTASWNYDGSFSKGSSSNNILGILEDHELNQIDKSLILKEAFETGRKVRWNTNKPGVTIAADIDGRTPDCKFVLSCGSWRHITNGNDLPGLRIVEN